MKIVQFKNSNNEDILPLAWNVGGTKIELLWTNPSPTSTFAGQTISLDLSDYDLLIVRVRFYTNTNNWCTNGIIFKTSTKQNVLCTGGGYASSREVTSVNDSQIVFGAGYQISSYATENNYCVPQAIYGIKTSYVVPTEVQGLQYVEVE